MHGFLPASVRDASVIGLIRFLPRSVSAMGGRHGETEGRQHVAAAGVIRLRERLQDWRKSRERGVALPDDF